MKKFRKLVPALCMLLVSAVLMGTSTYAWFSMNKKVTATGMEITAKADQVFLLINKTGTAGTGDTTVSLTQAGVKLFPAAIEDENKASADDATKWYTAYGTDRDNGAIVAESKTALTTKNFGNYVLKNTVYLTLAKGSKASGALTVQATTFTDNIGGAAKVLVVCGANTVVLSAASKTSDTTLAASVTADAAVKVDLYFYFDGNDSHITTAQFEANALTNATVDLQFDIADPA